MIAPRVVNVAWECHLDRARRRLNVISERSVERGPVDEVDQVDAERCRVGVDRGPSELKLGTFGQGRVGRRSSEVDGRDEGCRKGEERQETHVVQVCVLTHGGG